MSEAPERIWATPYDDFLDGGTFCDARDRPTAPNHDAWCYIRADLVEAAVRRALQAADRVVNATSAQVEGTPYSVGGRAFSDAIRAIADDTDAIAKIIKGET